MTSTRCSLPKRHPCQHGACALNFTISSCKRAARSGQTSPYDNACRTGFSIRLNFCLRICIRSATKMPRRKRAIRRWKRRQCGEIGDGMVQSTTAVARARRAEHPRVTPNRPAAPALRPVGGADARFPPRDLLRENGSFQVRRTRLAGVSSRAGRRRYRAAAWWPLSGCLSLPGYARDGHNSLI